MEEAIKTEAAGCDHHWDIVCKLTPPDQSVEGQVVWD